jgi:microtubule-associated protein-like 1/2
MPLGGSSGVDPTEGLTWLTLRGRKVPLYIPSDLIPDYEPNNPLPAPKEQLKLDWVYGYRGRDCRSNLYLLPTGELIYPIAGGSHDQADHNNK